LLFQNKNLRNLDSAGFPPVKEMSAFTHVHRGRVSYFFDAAMDDSLCWIN